MIRKIIIAGLICVVLGLNIGYNPMCKQICDSTHTALMLFHRTLCTPAHAYFVAMLGIVFTMMFFFVMQSYSHRFFIFIPERIISPPFRPPRFYR